MSKAGHTHSADGPDSCFGCRIKTVRLAADATPSRKPQVVENNRRDRNLSLDRDAYKRLRNDGLQPTHVSGSHIAEKAAVSEEHVEKGDFRDLKRG